MGNIQIGIAALGLSDTHCLIGEFNMEAVAVGGAVHSNRLNAHLPAGTNYPQGNFTSVSN
jgi:hypothetical protein